MSEETVLESPVPPSLAGAPLAEYLAGRFRYHDRERWAAIIESGAVTVNGAAVDAAYRVRARDIVSYRTVLDEPPVDRSLAILHLDEGFLAALKPGNLPCHADGNFIKNTAIYILRTRLAAQGITTPVHLVHRLDRETSGILIAAWDRAVHRALVRQFESGSVMKEYLAVVRGIVAEDRLVLEGAIGRDPASAVSIRHAVLPADHPGARPACTEVTVERRLAGYTLVRCRPRTGRTNQIRVHLAQAGHPLAGDKLYGRSDEEFLDFVRRARAGDHGPYPWLDAPRHLLHAASLSFIHPRTGEWTSFAAPLPEDMAAFIERMSG